MPTLLPSTQWLGIARKLWGLMTVRERWLSVSSLVLPILNRVAMLGSFGLAMKFIVAAGRGRIPDEWRWVFGIGIVVAFGLAGLLRQGGDKVAMALAVAASRIVRRIMGQNLHKARALPREEALEVMKNFRVVEATVVKTGSRVLLNFADLFSSVLLIAVLLVLITWMIPLIGVSMILGGAIVFGYFRHRIKSTTHDSREPLQKAKSDLKALIRNLVVGDKPANAILAKYENNRLDKIQSKRFIRAKKFKSKLSWIISGVGAVMMVAAFYLAGEGKLQGYDPILLILFAFALRFSMMQSQLALRKWSQLLREREVINLLRRLLTEAEGFVGTGDLTVSLSIDSDEQDENDGFGENDPSL